MKGVNTITASRDPGVDGRPGVGNNPNQFFGSDLTAFSLEYFNGDYAAINGTTPMASVNTSSHPATNSSQLFNGNIRYMQTRLTNPTTLAAMPMLNAYKYDQLNRLKESRSYETGFSSNVWNPTTYGNSYYNSFTYDAMGNIENQIRYSRNGTLIDNLTYYYQKSAGKLVRNRLYHLNDAQTNASAFGDDIDNMLAFHNFTKINIYNNYNYDEEGRLVKDSTEKISKIVWRVDGKVKEIQRNGGTAKWLKFDYDAMGHRIAKHVYNNTGTTLERSTYYILDAQGNTISTYDHEVVGGTAQFNLKERNIFGSSRIGSKQDSLNILTATITQNYTQVLGTKYYEFSNHLGNVLTVYSDVKIALDANSDGIVDGFRVPIRNTADYSPFGVQLDGRTVQGDFYRYGYQGSEKDDESKGGGNSYTTFFRQLDPRVGRWLSIDPKATHWESPYVSMHNNPIMFNDIMGDSIPTNFYNENGIKTNEIPDQVQKMFNNEYGISVGYQNGMLYKTGDVKTDLTVSSSAKADWESFLGTTNTDNSLTFGYNIGFSSNDNKQIPVLGGVSINYKDAYIDLADFNSDFSLNGAQYSKNKNDTGWGSATIPVRTQNLARTTEHEFFGHCVNNLTDDSFFTFGENNNFHCSAGEVEYKISNKYREEMGLLLRTNYLDNGHTSTQPSVNFMYVQYGHSYTYSSCPQTGDFPYQEYNSCYGTMRMSSGVKII